MPRRIPDYPDAFAGWNLICSYGSNISVVSTVLFFYIVFDGLTNKRALNLSKKESLYLNPWKNSCYSKVSQPDFTKEDRSFARPTTLEWATSSPPAFHTFNEVPVAVLTYNPHTKLSRKGSKSNIAWAKADLKNGHKRHDGQYSK